MPNSANSLGPSRWLVPFGRPEPGAPVLLCLPHAGGGASWFRPWAEHTSAAVVGVQLPGRGPRIAERPVSDLDELVAALVPEVRPLTASRYAVFGHSMGAIVAFELVRALRAEGLPEPLRLAVSGARPPHLPVRDPVHDVPRDRLVAWLRDLDGLSDELLEQPDVLDFALPALRADLRVVEARTHRPGPPLSCPITVLRGDRDPECDAADAAGWRGHTTGPCTERVFPGNHFFLDDDVPGVVSAVTEDLQIHVHSRRA